MIKPKALPPRAKLAAKVCELVGNDVVTTINLMDGWPSLVEVDVAGHRRRVALHVSLIGTHSRAAHEWRFQNPASSKPATNPGGSIPLLVGIQFEPTPILVVADGSSRLGRAARFGILFHDRIMADARRDGWSEYVSTNDEHIFALHPRMLPVLVDMLDTGIRPPVGDIVLATQASGLPDGGDEAVAGAAANRARRSAFVLVRHARFGNHVRAAYDGKCAMCGLGINLVQGAHIHPVSAPGSHDQVWNGLALCHNHHSLFDSHRLWVKPDDYRILKHPDLLATAAADPVVKLFCDQTLNTLRPPTLAANRPRKAMFEARYNHFDGLYDWK